MAAVRERHQDNKSAAERDIYDETPQEVLDLFHTLGLGDESKRAELSRLTELSTEDDGPGIHWIHTYSM